MGDIQSKSELNYIEGNHSLDQIMPDLSIVQKRMKQLSINSLVGGGVGADLAAIQLIEGHQLRYVELLIPMDQRGKFIDHLSELGFSFTPNIHKGYISMMSIN
jgi:hypothetical protein